MDERGNLSEQALIAWTGYVLDTCLDPIRFMAGLLDFESIKTRTEACLVYEEATVRKQSLRQEAPRGLQCLFLSCEEMPRGDFKAMLA